MLCSDLEFSTDTPSTTPCGKLFGTGNAYQGLASRDCSKFAITARHPDFVRGIRRRFELNLRQFSRRVCLWKNCAFLWRPRAFFCAISLAHPLTFRQNPPSRPFEDSDQSDWYCVVDFRTQLGIRKGGSWFAVPDLRG